MSIKRYEDVIECVYLMDSEEREEREREKVIIGVIEKCMLAPIDAKNKQEENNRTNEPIEMNTYAKVALARDPIVTVDWWPAFWLLGMREKITIDIGSQ